RQRADGGELAAMIGLAAMYQSGTEIEADPDQAVALYKKAAERGSSDAMLVLAALSFSGEAVEKDRQQAVRWMTQAAERGDPNAGTAWPRPTRRARACRGTRNRQLIGSDGRRCAIIPARRTGWR